MTTRSDQESRRRAVLLQNPGARIGTRETQGTALAISGVVLFAVAVAPGLPVPDGLRGALLVACSTAVVVGGILRAIARSTSHLGASFSSETAGSDEDGHGQHVGLREYQVVTCTPDEVAEIRPALLPTMFVTSAPTTNAVSRPINGGGWPPGRSTASVRLRVGVDDADGSPVRWFLGPLATERFHQTPEYAEGSTAHVREAAGAIAWVAGAGTSPSMAESSEPPSAEEWGETVWIVPLWWHLLSLLPAFWVAGLGGWSLGAGMVVFFIGGVLLTLAVVRVSRFARAEKSPAHPMLMAQPVRALTSRIPAPVWLVLSLACMAGLGVVDPESPATLVLTTLALLCLLEVLAAAGRLFMQRVRGSTRTR